MLDGGFDELGAVFLGLVHHVGGDFLDFEIFGLAGFVPDVCLHGEEVDDADEFTFRADRQDHDEWVGTEDFFHLGDDAVEVGTDAVEFIDVNDARNAGIVGVAPVGFGLGFDTAGAAEHTDTAVEDFEGAVNFDGEVHVAWGVDDVELVALPEASCGGGLDGDAALGFLFHEVHGGCAIVNFADFVNFAGELENALRGGGFARIDVGENADIAVFSEVLHADGVLRFRGRRDSAGGELLCEGDDLATLESDFGAFLIVPACVGGRASLALGGMEEFQKRPVMRQLSLDGMSPLEVAGGLRHLEGLVLFDTAGNVPSSAGRPISVVSARPVEVLRGRVDCAADLEVLRCALARTSVPAGDRGFPAGGLCGWCSYEGDFVFGNYPEMLIYSHYDQTWWEFGDLSAELRDNPLVAGEIGEFVGLTEGADFIRSVERAKEWIAAGDIYQVNLSQAFVAKVRGELFGFYQALRDASPAPMAAYLALDGREVLSSSPETFLKISGSGIETRPIKGTRPRFLDPDEDRRSAYELQTSGKEISELVMITDLLRNDLGQVCEFGSVEVGEMLQLESLAQVHHLVSTVTGRLRAGVDGLAAIAACFPGGSITGAPKKRAMEIIRELEPGPRGIYCGAIGWLGYNGESSLSIAIRTLVRTGDEMIYQVGAGIVADSDPEKEYEETLHKAAGIRLAVERFV
ncbi:MAG: hypothetical protein RLZZ245_276 [Verrucomicrobiota bacterium]